MNHNEKSTYKVVKVVSFLPSKTYGIAKVVPTDRMGEASCMKLYVFIAGGGMWNRHGQVTGGV